MILYSLFTRFSQAVDINPNEIDIPQNPVSESAITNGLQYFFGIAAAVAVLIISLSAFRMTISRGNPQDVQKSREAIIYACVGLAITLSGFAIVTFVIERIS